MEKTMLIDRLLNNINNIHELGKQRAFVLGNPFYAKYEGDGDYYHKELPTGEKFLVLVNVITDENDIAILIEDKVIEQL